MQLYIDEALQKKNHAKTPTGMKISIVILLYPSQPSMIQVFVLIKTLSDLEIRLIKLNTELRIITSE